MRPLDIQNPNLGRGSDLPATGSAVLEEPLVGYIRYHSLFIIRRIIMMLTMYL